MLILTAHYIFTLMQGMFYNDGISDLKKMGHNAQKVSEFYIYQKM